MTARRVVVCVDGSAHSDRAFQFYLEHLSRPDDLVYLAFVVEGSEFILPVHAGDSAPLTCRTVDAKVEAAKDAAKRVGYRLCCRLQEAGLARKFVLRVGFEPPGVFLSDLVKRKEAGLVVLGCRGRGPLSRTILGSVSTFMLHHSSIPVCVVPNPPAAASTSSTRHR